MKYRVHKWLDTKTLKTKYGLQGHTGSRRWLHVAEDGVPLFYDTEIEAKQKIKELKNEIINNGLL